MKRLGFLALALLIVSGAPALARAEADSEDSGDENPGVTGEDAHAQSALARRRDTGKQKRSRKSKVVGHAVPESQLRPTALPLPSGHVRLFGLASKEEVDLDIFNDDGSFDVYYSES